MTAVAAAVIAMIIDDHRSGRRDERLQPCGPVEPLTGPGAAQARHLRRAPRRMGGFISLKTISNHTGQPLRIAPMRSTPTATHGKDAANGRANGHTHGRRRLHASPNLIDYNH
jgi:hypothetical protein